MEKDSCYKILIDGIVQGIGFRPFIYNLAVEYKLKGYVKNTLKGVEILVKGEEDKIRAFIEDIKIRKPSLSVIRTLHYEKVFCDNNFEAFHIVPSESLNEKSIFILPDIGICDNCIEDFHNIKSPFYKYPFLTCTNCGPRYSIIERYPYDRINTTMNDFIMCERCYRDYKDIHSRRFHAETISCSKCGPSYSLLDENLNELKIEDMWSFINHKIKEGKIVAVKGIGGYHLVLDAKNIEAIKALRKRKKRDRKPFALLMKDIETIQKYCYINEVEKSLLESPSKPILLLRKKKTILEQEEDLISGNSPYYGVMLPYTPVHFLLMTECDILICTSANVSGEPIVFREEELDRLRGIADYFLIHNRRVLRFVEDSVLKVSQLPGRTLKIFYRKSRGYAPLTLFLSKKANKSIIGMGSDLKSTISLLKEDVLILSQYLGDLADYESYEAYTRCHNDLQDIFMFTPDVYVCDLHPAYLSRSFTESKAKKGNVYYVQHHKAHIASVLLENNWFEDNVLGVALDGTGYGEDGQIWGGEIFFGSLKKELKRLGGISYLKFPFGDKAVKDPERTFLAYFLQAGVDFESIKKELVSIDERSFSIMKNIVDRATIYASSTGRLFDAVSYLLGFRKKISYEGEAAIELENLIYLISDGTDFSNIYTSEFLIEDGRVTLDTRTILRHVFRDFVDKVNLSEISLRFHSSLVSGICKIIENYAYKFGVKKVVLSGGSFQNQFLLYHFFRILESKGFQVAINEYSPPNDACISIGQCGYIAFNEN
jgi:hydrogenase maturation protein HypF